MEGENPEVLLKFGENTLCLRKTSQPGDKPSCTEFYFLAEDFNKGKAEAELKRRGLNPVFDPELGWVFSDPDGLRIGVRSRKNVGTTNLMNLPALWRAAPPVRLIF